MFGTEEIILIFLAVLLLFGASKLPELARSFGSATGEFKKAQIQTDKELRELTSQDLLRNENILNNEKLRKDSSDNNSIHRLAKELNIDIVGKTDDKIMEEIRTIVDKR